MKRYNGTAWVDTTLRQYKTATDTLTSLPADVYADGTNATVGLKGNMSQTGTPTPSSPIQPQECGDLETTGAHAGQYKTPISSASTTTPVYLGEVQTTRKIKKLVLTGNETGWAKNDSISQSNAYYRSIFGYYRYNGLCSHYTTVDSISSETGVFFGGNINFLTTLSDEIDTVNKWKSYLQQQYAAGTPVTIWYVLATPTTSIVNEPIRKIGDYADTVSGITIPTITGKDTVDVETALKPSEVELTYTGWHDTYVKEKSENLYNINAKDVNNGYINNANLNQGGATETWAPCEVTEYIELVPNVSYRLSNIGSYNSLAYCIYDDNKQYITGEQYSGQPVKAINMPPNGKYLRFSHYKTITETMLNEGSTALPYEPYWK